jgi:hypothetical protein
VICTDAEEYDFASDLYPGFESILQSNAEGDGIILARSNKASATSTSSDTVRVDTLSSFVALGFDTLGFTVLLLGFRAKMPKDEERVLDGAGVLGEEEATPDGGGG